MKKNQRCTLAAIVCSYLTTTSVHPGEWTDSDLGEEALAADHVPRGFSQLVLDSGERTVECASGTKSVKLNDLGLTESLRVGTRPLLSSGATFRVDIEVDGVVAPGKLVLVRQEFTREGAGRVVVQTELLRNTGESSPPVPISVTTWLEYDFFIRHEVVVDFGAAHDYAVDWLSIEYPLRPGLVGMCAYTTEAPNGGEWSVDAESRRHLKSIPEAGISEGFCHYLWLGDTRTGFSWQFESARNWNTTEAEPLVFDPMTNVMSLRFVTKRSLIPEELPRRLKYAFAVQPTPVKDTPVNWRTWNIDARTSKIQGLSWPTEKRLLGNTLIHWNGLWRLSSLGLMDGIRDPAGLKDRVQSDRESGYTVLPYIVLQMLSHTHHATHPEDGNAGEECKAIPQSQCGMSYYYENGDLRDLAERLRIEPQPGDARDDDPPPGSELVTFDEWIDMWKPYSSGTPPNGSVKRAAVRLSDEWGDYLTWWLSGLLEENTEGELAAGYDMDGFFLDYGRGALPDFTEVAGYANGGFRDPRGELRPTYRTFAARGLLKRLLYLVERKDQDPPVGATCRSVGHTSGQKPVPLMGHYDAAVIGETFYWAYHYLSGQCPYGDLHNHPDPNEHSDPCPYSDKVVDVGHVADCPYYYAHLFDEVLGGIDELKAELYWRQWGVPHILLPEVRGSDGGLVGEHGSEELRRGTRTLLSYVLHFDLLLWPSWSDFTEVCNWWAIRGHFGMTDDVNFVPYWDVEEAVHQDTNADIRLRWVEPEFDAEKIKVSYYSRRGQAVDRLVVVSNLHERSVELGLQLPQNWRNCQVVELGECSVASSERPRAVECEETELTVTEREFRLALGSSDFAILRLRCDRGDGPWFVRGDCNNDGRVDISDAICTLNWLFLGTDTPGCVATTNANGDGAIDISDALYLLIHLLLGGPALAPPFPVCGPGFLPTDECKTPPAHCR